MAPQEGLAPSFPTLAARAGAARLSSGSRPGGSSGFQVEKDRFQSPACPPSAAASWAGGCAPRGWATSPEPVGYPGLAGLVLEAGGDAALAGALQQARAAMQSAAPARLHSSKQVGNQALKAAARSDI